MLPFSSQKSLTIRDWIKISVKLLCLIVSANTYAVTQQSFTLPITLEYDSNPRFSITNEQPVRRYSLTPEYSFRVTQGIDEWFATAGLHLENSSDQTINQDRTDPSLNVGWTHNYETGQFGVTAFLQNQSTRISEFTDSGLVEFSDNGLVSGDNTRKTRALSFEWLNDLSERTSLTVNSNVNTTVFEGPVTGLIGYRNEFLNAGLNYKLSEQMVAVTELFISQYTPDDVNSVSSRTAGFNLGFRWNINENFNMSLNAGTNETINNDQSKSRFKNWQATFNMSYITLFTSSSLFLSRNQSPGATGSLNENNQLEASWTYNLSEDDNFSLTYRWIENLTLGNIETKSLTTKYIHEINLSWGFVFSATHKTRDDILTRSSNNSVMASIIYNLPEF